MKNQVLLDKALALLPKLHETDVRVARTVTINKEDDSIRILPDEDYNKKLLKKGDKIILDFGNHQVGYISMKLNSVGFHADAPVWLKFHFAEQPVELFENGKDFEGWISSSWIEEEEIHVDVIPSKVKLSRRYAFRYLEIEVLAISNNYSLVVEDITCTAVSSADDRDLIPYDTTDENKKQLDKIAIRTLHNCMQTVFEDGPKRDRRLWIGDLRIQALANYETYKKNDLVKACMYLFAALPKSDEQIGACVFLEPKPAVDDNVTDGQGTFFDYALFIVSILYDYYRETSDREALEDIWSCAKKQIEIAARRVGEDGLIKGEDVFGWCFIDWNISLDKQASAQGVLMYVLNQAIYLASEIGDSEIEEEYRELYDKLYTAANRYLWDEEECCYVSGKDRQISIASQAWLVLGGAIEGIYAKKLLESIEFKENVQGMVSPYMYHHYVDALIQSDAKDLALEKMTEYWGDMLNQGADTFFELYNPMNPNESPYGGTIVNSYCHAWSCGPTYFLRKYFN